MALFVRKLSQFNITCIVKYNNKQLWLVQYRTSSFAANLYDTDKDPAPKFFSSNVQKILKKLTRPDYAKVFRKRTNTELKVLKTPCYKFLTDEELAMEIDKTSKKAEELLQMPPVVKISEPVVEVISKDPALIGYDESTYLFTDITFGVPNEHRLIVERDPDGILRSCDHDIRKRLNQTYFPMHGRKIKEPIMFSDEEKFNSLLEQEKYEFVLDRACIQYEPDEPSYQRITSLAYQHIDYNNKHELLRSTRHFGPLVFYLTWHNNMDNLMLELLQTGAIREAVLLVALRQSLLEDITGDISVSLTQQILPVSTQLSKPEQLTSDDIQLDNKCVECIEKYIKEKSAMKSKQELALQGFKEYYQQLVEISQGLRKAHGNS